MGPRSGHAPPHGLAAVRACGSGRLPRSGGVAGGGIILQQGYPQFIVARTATQEIISQFSALLGQISEAAIDQSIKREEAEEIREVWDKLKSYAEGFVVCCEKGDFERLVQIPPPSQGPRRLGM